MLKTPWNIITGLFAAHGALLSLLGGLSLLMFVGSLIAVPPVLVRLPEDYLCRDHKLLRDWPLHFSVAFLILKNGLGKPAFESPPIKSSRTAAKPSKT